MSVHALALSASHDFSKTPVHEITLLRGLGVKGDCHLGVTVQHRSRLHITPPPPNLRQVHLIAKETLDERGLVPGDIGENVTTAGIDLLALGRGTKLHFLPPSSPAGAPSPPLKTSEPGSENGNDRDETAEGDNHAVVVVQGLRNPCPQIDRFRAGLKDSFLVRDNERRIVRRLAGVMGTVERGGVVRVGMRIVVEEPEGGFEELGCV
ncbi:pyruvate kinase-like protein [Corynascus novoguineensis]|uniref:Pyruvate kinase-like protein n=1 Tax=Corynascus novoguineensis TaxID=1126955 RepID=A0AAN7CR43_9PEZI|nr:pyruvate kinase-like protein [Corynascus novoguineensis]